MKALEGLSVDEYYQTIVTWMKIADEKNKANGGSDRQTSSDDGKQRRSLKKK